MNRVLNLIDNRRLNALGRFVENQQFWIGQNRTTNRQLLLLTARQDAALTSQHVFDHWKQLIHLVESIATRGPRNTHTDFEVFLNRQIRKNVATLWHVAEPHPCALIGAQ